MIGSIDFELTNRCNAKCNFCPRDATPHQGIMSVEVFDQALVRAIEHREATRFGTLEPHVSLCGLGEPLLNRNAVAFTQRVTDEGFPVSLSSNGALLDERKATGLLEAGLTSIYFNIGDIDEGYEEVYRLPFAKTRDNIERFIQLAGDQCEVYIVLVNYKRDLAHGERMEQYWRDRGVTRFQRFDIINRGGALFVDHMQFEQLPELQQARELLDPEGTGRLPICGAPFLYLFVGYDGNYYLCCSDWTKEVPLGTVFERSFLDVTREKFEHVSRRHSICKTCNLDPLNAVTDELRAISDGVPDEGQIERMLHDMRTMNGGLLAGIERVVPGATAPVDDEGDDPPRRLIPVVAR